MINNTRQSVFQVENLIIKIGQLSITCAFVVLSWACSNILFRWKSLFLSYSFHLNETRRVQISMHAIIITLNSTFFCRPSSIDIEILPVRFVFSFYRYIVFVVLWCNQKKEALCSMNRKKQTFLWTSFHCQSLEKVNSSTIEAFWLIEDKWRDDDDDDVISVLLLSINYSVREKKNFDVFVWVTHTHIWLSGQTISR